MEIKNEESAASSEKMNWYAINKRYIPLKLMYFFFTAGQTCCASYRAVFMRHLGLSTEQAGIIWMVERMLLMIIPYIIGGFTDKKRNPKAVLMTLIIAGAIMQSSMYFIPQEKYVQNELGRPISIEEISSGEISFCWTISCKSTSDCSLFNPRSSTKICHPNATNLESYQCQRFFGRLIYYSVWHGMENDDNVTISLPEISSLTTSIQPCLDSVGRHNFSAMFLNEVRHNDSYYSNSLLLNLQDGLYYTKDSNASLLCYQKSNDTGGSCNSLVPNPVDEYGVTFWLLTGMIVISSITLAGVSPVLEATTFGVLGMKNRHRFGQQRMWASVGAGIAAFTVGYFRDLSASSTGPGSNREFLPMFLGVLICWSCAALVAHHLPVKKGKTNEKVRLRDIKIILKKPKAVAFYFALMIYGMSNAIQQIYLFWLVEAKLNSPSIVFGVATCLGSFTDILFCFWSGYLIKKFGHAALFCFGLIVYGIRIGVPAFIVNYWHLVATESLKGIGWGLTFVVVLSYTSKISPKGLENSAMGITQGIVRGVAFSIGSLLGGIIYRSMGGDFVFILFASSDVIAAIAFATFVLCTRKSAESTKEGRQGDAASEILGEGVDIED